MIKFVYFDVGGVVILDFSKTNKWKQVMDDLNLLADNQAMLNNLYDYYKREINTGMDIYDFQQAVEEKTNIRFPIDYSMNDDVVNRFEENKTIHPLLYSIKKKYKIGLLTNMYKDMLDKIFNRKLIPPIEWDVIVDSSVVGVQKPEQSIYEIAEEKAGLKGHEILFVDNKKGNIEATTKRGWQILHYDPADRENSNEALAKKLSL